MRRAFHLRLALLLGLTLGMQPGVWSTQSGGGAGVPSILVGQTLPGEIGQTQDSRTYRFDASAGVVYRLEVALDGLPAATLSLRASDGTTASGREVLERTVGCRLDWACRRSMDVLVTVRGRDGGTGGYLLTLSVLPPPSVPVIVIPGIGSCALDSDARLAPSLFAHWPWDVVAIPLWTSDPAHLQLDAEGRPVPGVSEGLVPTGLLDFKNPLTGADLPDLNDLVRYLQGDTAAYRLGQTLFVFAYDFRRSVEEIAGGEAEASLASMVRRVRAQTGAASVDIVAHSMGGLVAKAYLRAPESAASVRTVVMLGTPNLGAPAALEALRYGYEFGTSLIDPYKVKRAAHNAPGLYDLVPSAEYVRRTGGYFVDQAGLDGEPGMESPLSDPGRMVAFLLGAREVFAPLTPGRDPPPTGTLNPLQVERALSWHDGIDGWREPAGVRCYAVMGYNRLTPTRFAELRLPDGSLVAQVQWSMDGDSTVPLASHDAIRDGGVERAYYVDFLQGGTHAEYGSLGPVQNLVLELLRGREPSFRAGPLRDEIPLGALKPATEWHDLARVQRR